MFYYINTHVAVTLQSKEVEIWLLLQGEMKPNDVLVLVLANAPGVRVTKSGAYSICMGICITICIF